ncbi:MAG: hypothetical protein ACXWFF_07900 [Methylomonas sp.]
MSDVAPAACHHGCNSLVDISTISAEPVTEFPHLLNIKLSAGGTQPYLQIILLCRSPATCKCSMVIASGESFLHMPTTNNSGAK